MTTVRGKAPLECTFQPEVEALSHSQMVQIKSGGWIGHNRFYAVGQLSPSCASRLIFELRKALRKVRDDTRQRLDQAVSEAEKPL